MGQCRNLLSVNKIPQFRKFLEDTGYDVRDTKTQYSEFKVFINGKGYEIYVRDNTYAGNKTVHASIYGAVIPLARMFLNQSKPQPEEE